MPRRTKKKVTPDAKPSLAKTSESSNQIANIKATLISNGLTIQNQVMTQKRLEIRKGIESFKTGLKSITEGENPAHILQIPNEVYTFHLIFLIYLSVNINKINVLTLMVKCAMVILIIN